MWGIKSYRFPTPYTDAQPISFIHRFAAGDSNPHSLSHSHTHFSADRNSTSHSHLYADINS